MGRKILIVGGVAGGASAAARLRRLDETTEIVMLEKGEYISFANCGLPYYIGGEIKEKSALTLQTPQSFHARFNIDVRTSSEAVAIDRVHKTVSVKDKKTGRIYTENYDKLILSMGAEPMRPPVDGFELERVFTLRTIPDTYRIKAYIEERTPKSAVIIGGGYIGVEMAENLKKSGLDVTLIEMTEQVIAPLDYDMASDVHRHMEENGVKLLLNHTVRSIQIKKGKLAVTVNNGELLCDMAVLAVGVRPETKIAGEAGLALSSRGAVIVDAFMRTNDKDIYAIGDCAETEDFVTGEKTLIPLAGPANKQGRIAADHICGEKNSYTGTQGSAILKVFDMTAAATGMNEKTAKRMGIPYEKSFTYSASHAGYYPGAANMSVKVLFHPQTGKLLGAQLVGYEGVDKRCDVLATAIRAGMTVEDLTRLERCYAPPSSSAKDPVNMAGFGAENILRGKVKNIHWHDIPELPRDGSVQLVDVRNELEYAGGHIGGFINIPLDSLRGRLGELDKRKKVYVTCQIGLRGYIAARILMQNGFETYNLSGGYRLYQSIFGTDGPPPFTKAIETQAPEIAEQNGGRTITLDTCGMACPKPMEKLVSVLNEAENGETVLFRTTDRTLAQNLENDRVSAGSRVDKAQNDKGIYTVWLKKEEDGKKDERYKKGE